jgi:hypothetical protein
MKLFLSAVAFAGVAMSQPGPVMSAVIPAYETAKKNMVEAAEVMPEAEYAFKLSPAQRAFGEWIDHTAGMNFRMCATMKGEQPPAAPAGGKTKADLVKNIEASFNYCDSVIKSMSDSAATSEAGAGKVTPLSVMIGQLAQLNSHYGNMVGYLRAKGITPPSTARSQAAQKK